MNNLIGSAERRSEALFEPVVYRQLNLDLRAPGDAELREHVRCHPDEPRLFGPTNSTAEFMSMRWLRGQGLEVGAGSNPTPLFRDATALQVDCDAGLSFGGKRIELQDSIDEVTFAKGHAGVFDFLVASHVLEHVDSFVRAVENCCTLTRAPGIVYLVLPDITFLHDSRWLRAFNFSHHCREYDDPLSFASEHDQDYIAASSRGIDHINAHAVLPEGYREAILCCALPQEYRFLHHKPNYKFAGWLQLLFEVSKFLDDRFVLEDARYGHDRLDCHFVLKTLGQGSGK